MSIQASSPASESTAGPVIPSPPTASQPRVLALVLSYEGKDVALQTLASLVETTYAPFDIALIDNGSTDGTADAVAAEFPTVSIVTVPENRGISHGMNFGLRWALERPYDYVLILNNDIEVDPEMVTEMLQVADRDPSLGAVGPKSYYFWDRERLWSAGGVLRFRESVTRERGDGEIDRGQFDRDEEVDYVNGCAMLVRRQALVDTGLWDSTYFLGVEDADWCMRMKRHGWRCGYAHRAKLWHMISHSTGVYKPFRTFHTGRSTGIFVRKFASPLQWLGFVAFTLAALPLAFVRELRHGNQRAAIEKGRGILEGLRVPLRPIEPAPGTAREAGE